MELSIGSRIYLKRDFIKQFEPDSSKTSRSFRIIALTDVAVGLKNLRTNRTYTLSLARVADNIEPVPQSIMPKGRVVLGANIPPPPLEDNNDTPPPEDNNDTPLETFTHIAPVPSGGIIIKRINAITQVESGDDPFGDLYT